LICAIHQLHYMPWIRYIHKMACADVFVVLDDIQYNKNGWQNRNRIKGPQGPFLLTVPVHGGYQQTLDEVRVDNRGRWAGKHAKALRMNYESAGFYAEHEGFLSSVYSRRWGRLNDINWEMLRYLASALGLRARMVRSSELGTEGDATERLVSICRAVGADTYVTGAYAVKVYLDVPLMERAGLRLLYQRFECPEYPQRYEASGFVPDLSIWDMLLMCGPRTLEIIESAGGVDTTLPADVSA